MIGKLKEELLRTPGGEWVVSFTTREDPRKMMDRLKGSDVSIEIKKQDPKRSKDANALCWALCSDIGKAIYPPLSKEDVYRKAIRAVGVFTEVKVCIWELDTLLERWSSHGTGWFIDVVDDAGAGHKKIHMYYGSSTYTVNEMRILLDWLVDQAEQMDIPLRFSREEEERVLALWGKASSKKSENATCAAS